MATLFVIPAEAGILVQIATPFPFVIPAQAGIQRTRRSTLVAMRRRTRSTGATPFCHSLDSRLRGNDDSAA
jgi:hypothetical protein